MVSRMARRVSRGSCFDVDGSFRRLLQGSGRIARRAVLYSLLDPFHHSARALRAAAARLADGDALAATPLNKRIEGVSRLMDSLGESELFVHDAMEHAQRHVAQLLAVECRMQLVDRVELQQQRCWVKTLLEAGLGQLAQPVAKWRGKPPKHLLNFYESLYRNLLQLLLLCRR